MDDVGVDNDVTCTADLNEINRILKYQFVWPDYCYSCYYKRWGYYYCYWTRYYWYSYF